jgi:hypothetical protein
MNQFPAHARFIAQPLVPVERQILEALLRGQIVIPRFESVGDAFDLVAMLAAMSIDGLVTAEVTDSELVYTINGEGRSALSAPRCQ